MKEIEKINVNNITMDSIFSTLVEIQGVNPAALAVSKRYFNNAKDYYIKAHKKIKDKKFKKNEKVEFVNINDIILANNIYQQIKDYNIENLIIVFELISALLQNDLKDKNGRL